MNNLLYSLINALIPFALMVTQLQLAFKDKPRFPQKKFIGILVGTTAVVAAVALFSLTIPLEAASRLFYILNYLAFPLAAEFILFRCTFYEGIFTFFITKCYMDDVFTLAKILQAYLFERIRSRTDEVNFITAYAIVLVLTYPLILLFMQKLMRRLINTVEHIEFWKYIWMVPVSFYAIYKLGISPDYMKTQQVWGHTKVALPVSWIFCTFLVYGILVRMVVALVDAMREKERLKTMALKMSIMEEQYAKIQGNIEETKRMRHDLRHEALFMRGMLEKRDLKGMGAYLNRYLDMPGIHPRGVAYCENYAVNGVVEHFLGLAGGEGMEVHTDICFPAEMPFDEKDLCIVLGNLLENALEACRRQKSGKKLIQIRGGMKSGKILAVVIKNTYEGEIRRIDGRFLSSKRKETGIGISSVCSVAEKYHGIANFEYQNGIFTASLLLNG